MSQDQFVLPGDIIVTGDYQPEQNVVLDGDRLISTAIGFSEIKDDLVTVTCLLYTSPSPRDKRQSRMPSSA